MATEEPSAIPSDVNVGAQMPDSIPTAQNSITAPSSTQGSFIEEKQETTTSEDLSSYKELSSTKSTKKKTKARWLYCCYHTSEEDSNSARVRNLIFLLIGTMLFKFSLETVSNAIAQFVLNRFSPNGATILGVLTVLYGVSQGLASTIIDPVVRKIRANVLMVLALLFFAVLIIIFMALELFTKGTWTPWLLFPIYIGIGSCLGVIEVVRKVLPPLILGKGASVGLKRLNSAIHIAYEVAGTAGAFLSTVWIQYLGYVYGLVHLPIAFTLSSIAFLMINHKFEKHVDEEVQQQEEETKEPLTTKQKAKQNCMNLLTGIKQYFVGVIMGARVIICNRKFNWLLICFVVPQVLHRVIENVFLPLYSKEILKDGSLSGIMLGGSNFGELCGAAMTLVLSHWIHNAMHFVRADAIFINLMWLFIAIPNFHSIGLAVVLAVMMMFVSGSWAAGDISLLAYIQHHIPEKSDRGSLASAMSFLYASYVVVVTLLVLAIGQIADQFKKIGQITYGLMTMCIIFTVIGAVIVIVSLFAKQDHSTNKPEESEKEQKEEKDSQEPAVPTVGLQDPSISAIVVEPIHELQEPSEVPVDVSGISLQVTVELSNGTAETKPQPEALSL